MKKLKVFFTAILFTIIMLFIMQKSSYAASDFSYRSMDVDVNVNRDGSMDVVETWVIKINEETNTLFKNWELDSEKFSTIDNVRVTKVNSNGTEFELNKINKQMYHVTTDDFYAMNILGGKFEIAWGVNKKSGVYTYKMYYTVYDCVKVYNDCADLYWKFINETSGTVNNITGTINMPVAVNNIENLKVWGHGDVNGETKRKDEKTIEFSAKKYNSKFLEVRIVTTEDMFSEAEKINEYKLQEILEYEKDLADSANRKKRLREIFFAIILCVIYIINLAIFAYVIKKKSILKENPKKVPTQKFEYYRDFPRKDDTPAQVAFLHYFKTGRTRKAVGKIFSATMLDLCLKEYLKFEMNKNGKVRKSEKVKVIIDKNKDTTNLQESEKVILELLKKVAGNEDSFTMRYLEKYAKNNNTTFYSAINKLEGVTSKEQDEIGNYSVKEVKQSMKYKGFAMVIAVFTIMQLIFIISLIGNIAPSTTSTVALMFIALFTVIMLLKAFSKLKGLTLIIIIIFFALTQFVIIPNVTIKPIPLIIGIVPLVFIILYSIITLLRISNRLNGLTQSGVDEQEKLRALKKYMEDFSLLKEREVPELILWEKYLVYATTMGVADKVLEQLKVVYPQFEENSEVLVNTSYLYIMSNSNIGASFISSINSSVNKAYISSAPSSPSGGGGGFSGGGGGGRRWRIQWRSLTSRCIN